jgi:hypothetical protein
MSRHNGGMRREIKNETTPFAGGLGARCAPSGEREGQSPLARPFEAREREGPGTLWVPPRRCLALSYSVGSVGSETVLKQYSRVA